MSIFKTVLSLFWESLHNSRKIVFEFAETTKALATAGKTIPKSLKFNPEWKSLNPLNWSDTVIYHQNFVDLVVPDLTCLWRCPWDRKLLNAWAGVFNVPWDRKLGNCPWPIPTKYSTKYDFPFCLWFRQQSERLEAIVMLWHEFHLQTSQNKPRNDGKLSKYSGLFWILEALFQLKIGHTLAFPGKNCWHCEKFNQ